MGIYNKPPPTIHGLPRTGLITARLAFVFLTVLAPHVSQAQSQSETQSDVEQQILEIERVRAAMASGALGPLKRQVTYAEVLADPDNTELNILYARTQILNGRLDRAQAALERILLKAPELTFVRMLYGIVLYRLGNFVEAESVFNKLLTFDISAKDKILVQQYLDKITYKSKRTRATASLSMGIYYDDNRNSSPSSGTLSLFDTILTADSKEMDDIGRMVSVSFDVRHDLGYQRPHEVYGKLSLTRTSQVEHDNLDLFMTGLDVGGIYATDIGNFDLSVTQNSMTLGSKDYLLSIGPVLRWDAVGGNMFRPYVEGSASKQIYRSEASSSGPEQTGWKMISRLGTKISFSPTAITDIQVYGGKKTAAAQYKAHAIYGSSLTQTWLFEGGRFLMGYGSYEDNLYRKSDLFVSSKNRHDRRARLRLTAGTPLATLPGGAWLPAGLQSVQLIGSVERAITFSNIVNYAYDNWRGQVLLTKSFSF